jgi:PadR family transcriptional regulator, regulatory protein PadR
MSLSKARVWGMLTWFSFIAVTVRGPAILADASRTGRRAGLLALAHLIPGSALSRTLPAAPSRPNDGPKHAKVSPDNRRSSRRMAIPTPRVLRALLAGPARETHGPKIRAAADLPSGFIYPILARLEADYGWVTSREEDIDLKDESRPRRRFHRLAADRTEPARATQDSVRIGSLPAVWLSARWEEISLKHPHAALTLASPGLRYARPAPRRASAGRHVARLGWAA